jgi:hypothetical protein
VGSWYSPRHSVITPQETVARVVAALCEWRGWLESLAGWFKAYPLDLAAVEDQRILWERAARNLILQVVDRTGHGTGWHGHCTLVLTWFPDRWHIAPDIAQDLVAQAIGGRFHSWASPDTVLVDDVAERLALSLRSDDASRPTEPTPDHLRRWLAVRESVPGNARSAFLALVFVLAREGIALNGVSLLRRISFQADDPQDPLPLARYIDLHITETRRTTSSDRPPN